MSMARRRFATVEERVAVTLLFFAVMFLFAAIAIGDGVGEGLVVGAVFLFLFALFLALSGFFVLGDGKPRSSPPLETA